MTQVEKKDLESNNYRAMGVGGGVYDRSEEEGGAIKDT